MLRFQHVGKVYRALWKSVHAVADFDLSVEPGDTVGLIGANGAGKTTLIHLALGYLHPTRGSIAACDRPAGDPATRRSIGWTPDEPIYPRSATARGLLDRWLAGHGLNRTERAERIEQNLERFGMRHAADRRINTYSLGMQQKTSLMIALSHRPKLLILDEPFSALDHRSLLMVRRELEAFRAGGGATLVSSHHLSELESLCTRAVFLNKGRIQRDEQLNANGAARVQLELGNSGRARELLEQRTIPWFDDWEIRDDALLGRVAHRDRLAELIAFLVQHDVAVKSAVESTSRLEEAFLELEQGN